MNALYNHVLYGVIDTEGNDITLIALDSDKTITVPLSHDLLVIDPTDGELSEAEVMRECRHPNFWTVNDRLWMHRCRDCQQLFQDDSRKAFVRMSSRE